MEKLLSITEAAEVMNVQEETVRQWLRSGRLKGLKAGRVWRIKPSAVELFLGSADEETLTHDDAEMFFKSDAHRKLYIYMLANVPSSGYKHNIACYLIASTENKKVVRYMVNGIDIEGMRKDLHLSDSEDAIVQIAGCIYEESSCDMSLLSRFDREEMEVVIEAIKNRYLS